jgi:hypothetical protein
MITASFIVLASISAGLAQSAQQPTQTQTASVPLTCFDFQRNPNGSWSPMHPIQINGVGMGPSVAFNPGVAFGGVDLATALNQQCPFR